MFKTTLVLSALSGLLLATACSRPAAPALRDGSVEFVASGASTADVDGAVPGRLTITGLDRALRVQVALPSGADSRNLRVELPAGLYAIDAAASASGNEPVIPALSAPRWVVVTEGQVSTVNVLVVGAEPPALAALDAALEP